MGGNNLDESSVGSQNHWRDHIPKISRDLASRHGNVLFHGRIEGHQLHVEACILKITLLSSHKKRQRLYHRKRAKLDGNRRGFSSFILT